MRPIVASPSEYGYRNRIRVHVESSRAGFYGRNGHDLVEIDSCVIASPQVNQRLGELRGRALYDGDYTLAENPSGRFFSQTNDGVAGMLLDLVEGLVKPGGDLLVDAYCGAGFFAKRLRSSFQQVIGIEENEHAVAQAREGAGPGETYFSGDVELHLGDALSSREAVTLVLDPPATGITPRVSDIILAAMPREIVYVSCNPATLARDLSQLCLSYKLISVTPLDMFPQTAEIEVAVHLRK
jgi:23S rRNA (uracil1939-C5)-methyltransferase